ncbi:PadR family transcriptional regulator [Streptomyces scopuliridis]|uniref:PadR family transcriptional regulator n=1 Tax=Streptomyces scopuliridis TaxID=452529 RepID=UPI0036BF335D
MSATRLLVLGVVRTHGTAHGYLITSELESMWAQEWAKLKSGSIYHALRQLAKDGLMRATQIEEWPGRVDYEITEQGDAEFLRLLREALKRPRSPSRSAGRRAGPAHGAATRRGRRAAEGTARRPGGGA